MADVTEKVLPHLESMQPDSILDPVNEIEKYDRLAHCNYGLSDKKGRSGSLELNVLTAGGRTIIAVDQRPKSDAFGQVSCRTTIRLRLRRGHRLLKLFRQSSTSRRAREFQSARSRLSDGPSIALP